MCDVSFEMEIERVTSEKAKAFDIVPEDIMFTFRFKTEENKTYAWFKYELEKGKILPHSTMLKGLIKNNLTFCSRYFFKGKM